MGIFQFIKRFFDAPFAVGSIAPSSSALANALLGIYPDHSQIKNFVEVGAGTGAITKFISDAVPEDAKVSVFEIHPDFAEQLKKDYPKFSVLGEDAAKMRILISEPVDFIVCSLPWTLFPREKRRELLAAFREALHPEKGVMVTFVYIHMLPLPQYRELMEDFSVYFKSVVKEGVVYENLPPAQVITLTG